MLAESRFLQLIYRAHLKSLDSYVTIVRRSSKQGRMSYSSSLTDKEWENLEPLLPNVLPQKNKTKPVEWSYRELIDGMLYRLKNGCNWGDLPKDLPPYSTVFYHYNQWRKAGTLSKLMTILHEQVRGQQKKA